MKTFRENETVRFNAKWCSPDEVGRAYRIVECFDDVQRAHITPVETSLSIAPVEVVTYDMIEKMEEA